MTGTDWLDQLEQKAAAATAGEWVQNGRNGIHTPVGSCIATTHRHEDDQRKADAEFIAAANPHTVQRLIDEVRQATRSSDIWRGKYDRLSHEHDHLTTRMPCTYGCVGHGAPEEDCPRHGRSPAEVWQIVTEVQAQRDALAAKVAAVEALADTWDRLAVLANAAKGYRDAEIWTNRSSDLRAALAGGGDQ